MPIGHVQVQVDSETERFMWAHSQIVFNDAFWSSAQSFYLSKFANIGEAFG
jgi:hypothetical protein